jgi:hypothetical protein
VLILRCLFAVLKGKKFMRIVIKPIGAFVLLSAALMLGTVVLRNIGPKATAGKANLPLLVMTDTGKKAWLQDQIYRFNIARAEPLGRTPFGVVLRDTRAADVADRTANEPPRLWMFSGGGWSRVGSGEAAPRPLFTTPLVLVTTKARAAALRSRLVGVRAPDSTFTALGEVVGGRWSVIGGQKGTISTLGLTDFVSFTGHRPLTTEHAPVTFTHADPQTTADGLAIRGLLLADFAARRAMSAEKAASDPAFAAFVRRLYAGFRTNDPVLANDPSALARAFARDPSRADILICAESDALLAVRENTNLVVLTPQPTTLLPQSVAIVGAEKLTAVTRPAAETLLETLTSPEAVADGLQDGFRPTSGGPSPGLKKYEGQGFLPIIRGARPLPSLSLMEKAASL